MPETVFSAGTAVQPTAPDDDYCDHYLHMLEECTFQTEAPVKCICLTCPTFPVSSYSGNRLYVRTAAPRSVETGKNVLVKEHEGSTGSGRHGFSVYLSVGASNVYHGICLTCQEKHKVEFRPSSVIAAFYGENKYSSSTIGKYTTMRRDIGPLLDLPFRPSMVMEMMNELEGIYRIAGVEGRTVTIYRAGSGPVQVSYHYLSGNIMERVPTRREIYEAAGQYIFGVSGDVHHRDHGISSVEAVGIEGEFLGRCPSCREDVSFDASDVERIYGEDNSSEQAAPNPRARSQRCRPVNLTVGMRLVWRRARFLQAVERSATCAHIGTSSAGAMVEILRNGEPITVRQIYASEAGLFYGMAGRIWCCTDFMVVPGIEPSEEADESAVPSGPREFKKKKLAINAKEVKKFMHYFRTGLRAGVELEKHNEEDEDERPGLESDLRPTGSYESLGTYGVVEIVDDGSICGAEILAIGTNEDWDSYLERMERIHRVLDDHGYYADSDCGMHVHLLVTQQRHIPRAILANLYQLMRIYAPGLIWLTAAQKNLGVCRGNKYAKWEIVMRKSPLSSSMSEICSSGTHYEGFNVFLQGHSHGEEPLMRFDGNGDPVNFHVEARFPDATDSPVHIAATVHILRAMVLRAVELSEFGVIDAKTCVQDWENHKRIVYECSEEMERAGRNPHSDYMKKSAGELVSEIKNHLLSFGEHALGVVKKMVENPVSSLLSANKTWSQIDRYYYNPAEEPATKKKIREAVISGKYKGHRTRIAWLRKLSASENIPVTDLKRISRDMRLSRELLWEQESGEFVCLY